MTAGELVAVTRKFRGETRGREAALDRPAGCGSVQGGRTEDLQAWFPLMVIEENGKVEVGCSNTWLVCGALGIGMPTLLR